MTPDTAALMARYNRWMNERLYEAAARLAPDALAADKGAFFGSILGTLNHIAVADMIWLHRLAGHPAGQPLRAALSDLPAPASLRQMLAEDLPGLQALRTRLDAILATWVDGLTPEQLAAGLSYRNMAGVPATKRLGEVLMHVFNHQTHHRGQATTLLFQSGVDVGVTDLITQIPNQEE